jgi:hypothetical protein
VFPPLGSLSEALARTIFITELKAKLGNAQ